MIIAAAIFVLVKLVNIATRKPVSNEPVVPPPPSASELLLAEIRDELRRKG
jgi:large-conductance mechanosensitive channel